MKPKKIGKAFLAGAGPGHPGLVTLRAVEVLRLADVVVYDHLSNPELLRVCKPGAELIYAGKSAGRHALSQIEIQKLLVRAAQAGKTVVRLKGGDPYLFGRGGEEAEFLREHGVAFETIPGVSAASAVPAFAGIPITHRRVASAVAFVTGHLDPAKSDASIDYEALARFPGTLVFFMGVERLAAIVRCLIESGKNPRTPAALIRWGTLPRQQTLTASLEKLPELAAKAKFRPPALLVIGDVVSLRASLCWYEKLPLFGKRVVVTRTRTQAGELTARLLEIGADVIELPTIEIRPARNQAPLIQALERLSEFSWVVFSSPNAVEHFFEAFFESHRDIRALGSCRLAAIGPATAAKLSQRGLDVAKLPDSFVAESLAKSMRRQKVRGRVLLPRGNLARDVLPRELRKAGFQVETVLVYETIPATGKRQGHDALRRLRREGADFVTFTSSSTAEHFVRLLGRAGVRKLPGRPRFISIGPVTSRTLRQLGLKVACQAKTYTVPGVVEALVQASGNRTRSARRR
ncbi:MAG: uroporphyrinogen-III C-methyltransferase [Verrucomicrobiae bacterium]|nr:uroporphyrinogen-III C-methyltransferase [Verrucomicrobiae bacterium]